MDKIHSRKARKSRISIEINSPSSEGHSTDSESPEVRKMLAPRKTKRKLESENFTSKVINIHKCEKRSSGSPFNDERLGSFGKSSKLISDYKKDMEALFNEINKKERSQSGKRQSQIVSYKSNLQIHKLKSRRTLQNEIIKSSSTNLGPVKAFEIKLLNTEKTQNNVFMTGNSPFIEMNFQNS